MRGPLFSRKVLIFLGITLVLVLYPYFEIIHSGMLQAVPTLLLMWAPGVAAMITQLITARSLAGLGWRLGEARWLLPSFFIPLGVCIVVYGLLWGVGVIPFTGAELVSTVGTATGLSMSLPLAILATVVVLILPSLFSALGEELGWRGLLVPELAKKNRFAATVVISSVIWALYHYPAILLADYHSSAPVWFALPVFTISLFSVSLIAAWLRLKSGSVWTAALLHASHNLFVQSVFDPLTLDFGLTPYLTTEFGAGLAIAYALIAFYYWQRRGEVEETR